MVTDDALKAGQPGRTQQHLAHQEEQGEQSLAAVLLQQGRGQGCMPHPFPHTARAVHTGPRDALPGAVIELQLAWAGRRP